MKSKIYIVLICISLAFNASAQTETELINKQVWEVFSEAFATLDYKLFETIHHPSFLRINGNEDIIKSRAEYLGSYENNWQNKDRELKIEFRFLERIADEYYASERGIYKLTINPGNSNAASYYGKFHVVMKQENGKWKLTMDYDSNEENSIGEDDFKSASPM